MKLGIMQPYFLPYIGYWQLLNAVDKYVIYDDVNFIKGGWINRNRILQNGSAAYINIPMIGASSFKKINEIQINRHPRLIEKLLKTVAQNYSKAPEFKTVMPLFVSILEYREDNLAKFLINSIRRVCEYLQIHTEIVISSSLNKNNSLHGKDKVINICNHLGATEYINAIGGRELYDRDEFAQHGVALSFLETENISYKQCGTCFTPGLSILDVMMFNSREEISYYLNCFTLVK